MKYMCYALLALSIGTAHAAEPKKKLAATVATMKAVTDETKALDLQADALREEKAKLQKTMVELAADLQKQERRLIASQRALSTVRATIKQKEEAIAVRKKRLSMYTHTLLRLSDMPPEAMLVLPEISSNQIEAAAALKMITAQATADTRVLEDDLEALHAAENKQADEAAAMQALMEEQRKGRAALESKLQEREQAYGTVEAERAAKQKKLKALSKEASSLKELMNALSKHEEPPIAAPKADKQSREKKALRSFANAKGNIHLPVAGRAIKHFGQETPRGNKGVVIETREHATVTAPFSGEVMFAGSFMNYGQMVIIRHHDDFHSLIAGLSTINTRVGEFLLEGEPIGAMGEDASPQLYFELRKGTQPIDPAAWVTGL